MGSKCQGFSELHCARKSDGMLFKKLHVSAAETHGDRDKAAAEILSAPKYSKFCSLAVQNCWLQLRQPARGAEACTPSPQAE